MADEILIEVFDQCVLRLEQGETIEDCAQSYPQYANDLRLMLEATQVPRRAQATDNEVVQAQERVESRFEKALNQTVTIRKPYLLHRIASILLVLLFAMSLLTTGVVIVAQDSLPGDNLYGVKRFSEHLRLSFSNDSTELEVKFEQRRRDEINQLFDLDREVDVQFVGDVEEIEENQIRVTGIAVKLPEDLRTIELIQGMHVKVNATTQHDRTVLATAIQILETRDTSPQPYSAPTAMTLTAIPTANTIQPSPTNTTRSTSRPTLTDLPTQRPTVINTPLSGQVTAQAQFDSPTETCGLPPEGWIRYTIQRGDTPSEVAVSTGLSLDEFYAANCNMNPRFVVGDAVYVPYAPRFASTATDEFQRTPAENSVSTAESLMRPTEVQRELSRPTATPDRERSGSDDNENQRDRKNDDEEEGRNDRRGR